MLNKKDPLIAAVQQVMQQSNAEREATRIVNERFGIESRKSLPHEYQAQWNAEYQQVLSEAAEGSIPKTPKEKALAKKYGHPGRITRGDVIAGRLDELKGGGDDPVPNLSAFLGPEISRKARAGNAKAGRVGFDTSKPQKPKSDSTPIEIKEEDYELASIQEEIAYNLVEQAEYVYENYGEEGLVEFFESLTEEQLEILSIMEENMAGTPIRTNIGSWLSKAKDYIMNPQGIKSLPSYQGSAGQKADKTSAAIQNMNATAGQQSGQGTSGPNRGLGTSPAAPGKSTVPVPKPKPQNTASAPAAKSTNTSTAPKVATAAPKKVKKVVPSDIGSGGKQERGSSLGVTTGTTTGTTATNRPSRPLSKAMRDNPVASFRKAPKATVGAALRKPGAARNALKDKGVTRAGVARGIGNARSGKGSFGGGNRGGGMGGRGGRGGEGRGGRGSLKEQIQNIVAQKIMEAEGSAAGMSYDKNSPTINSLRNKMYGSNPTPRTVQTGTQKIDTSAISPVVGSTTVAPRGPDTQALSNTARRASSGDVAPGSQKGANRVGAVIRTNAERIASRTGQNKSFDASYNAAAGTNPRNTALDQPNSQSPMAKAIANKVAMTARKIEAPGRQVSAKEIMNSKQYKQGVKDVGGEAAARKIKPGTNVAGVGKIEKGQTIYGNVEKQLSRTAVRGFEARKGGGGR